MNYFEAALTGNDDLIEDSEQEPGELGDAEEFKQVLDELDDMGRHLDLAETTGRWMRLGEHAGRLRATCLEAGLGERLTGGLVRAFIAAELPTAIC